MDPAIVTSIALGVPGLLSGGWIGLKQVRSVTAADKDRAAQSVQDRIDKAVKASDDACKVRLDAKDERIADILRDLAVATKRAESAEAREHELQQSINERGLGPTK